MDGHNELHRALNARLNALEGLCDKLAEQFDQSERKLYAVIESLDPDGTGDLDPIPDENSEE